MKKILQSIFFWHSPAQGAFFGLTLAGLTVWLLPSIVFVFWAYGSYGFTWLSAWNDAWPPFLIVFLGVAALLLVYATFLCLRFYGWFCRRKYGLLALWLCLALFAICLVVACFKYGDLGFFVTFCVFFGALFPLILLPKWWLWLTQACCWSLGLLFGDVVLRHLLDPFLPRRLGQEIVNLPHAYISIQKFLHVIGMGWAWLLAAGALFLLLGYLLTALLWARAADLPFRRLFGKGVACLWSIFAVAYVAQLILAFLGSQAANQEIAALEKHIGRPLTASALKEWHLSEEQPDPAFWEHVKTLTEDCEPFYEPFSNFYYSGPPFRYSGPPDVQPQEAMQQWQQHVQKHEDCLSSLEKLFSESPPAIPQCYGFFDLDISTLSHLPKIRQLNRIASWRIYLALANGDANTAIVTAKMQANINNTLLRNTDLTGGLVWIACVNIWLKSIERMLESQVLTDEHLHTLAGLVKTTVDKMPAMQKRLLYDLAVCALEAFEVIGKGSIFMSQQEREKPYEAVPMRPLRFFAPHLWWYAAMDKAYMARSLQVEHLAEISHLDGICTVPLCSSSWMLVGASRAGQRFHAVNANLLAMQALIKVELHRRTHGTYPEQLENPPTDPFNGEPMRYRHGDCRFKVRSAEWNEKGQQWRIVSQTKVGPGVQVWSVGPDLIDDDKINLQEPDDERRSDDIRALMRLKTEEVKIGP
ncbi:MAG: hypothetical protein GX937_09120 [Lentisphaerae bacterium]|jgi:hypothetical protein|nr:hypothetical protein [Lentisphaerota bacterium]